MSISGNACTSDLAFRSLLQHRSRFKSTAFSVLFALALIAGAAQESLPQDDPPFAGTVYIDPDIITTSDPTTFQGVTAAGRGVRTMFDRRVDAFVAINAYLFDATFDDGLSAEIQVNPEFGNSSAAMAEAEHYGRIIGQLPTALRVELETVWIHKGDELLGGGNNNILIHTDHAEASEQNGFLEEELAHEGAHTSLDAAHADAPAWRLAQARDGGYISTYARDFPDREDIAESFLPYLAVRYRPERIPASDEQSILDTMPNRIAYFDVQSFDMYPVVAREGSDAFGSASAISGASGQAAGSSVGASKESGEPDHAGNRGGASLWWSWTAPASGTVTIDTQGSDFDTLLAVYTGGSVDALTVVASNDDAIGLQSEVSFTAQQGVVYHIAVDGYSGATGSVVLGWDQDDGSGTTCDPNLACGAAITCVDGLEYPTICGPLNCDLPIGVCNGAGAGSDTFSSASGISGASGEVTGSNVGASKESGEPDHAGNRGGASLWWSWTAPVGGMVTIDTQGSDFDTVLAVYTGGSVDALTSVASNDDATGLQSEVSFTAQQGVVYHIAVDGYSGATGSIMLGWSQAGDDDMACVPDPNLACTAAFTCFDGLLYPTGCGPLNCDLPVGTCENGYPVTGVGAGSDTFSSASGISGASGEVTGSNVGASKESGEPDHAGNRGGASLWWSWTSPAGGTVTIDTQGSDFDTLLAVYTGSSVDALTVVASNDDAIGLQSEVSFTAQQGVVYHIAVDGYSGATGSIVLNTDGPDLGTMACWIGAAMTEPDDSTNGVPEAEGGTGDSSDDDTATTTPSDVDDPDPLQGTVEIAGMDEDVTDLETDAYEIVIAGDDAPAIMGDTLTVTVSRGGGCEDHDFTLVVDQKLRMREPPELDFTIVHDNMGDVCEAYPTDDVEFDLTQIKDLVGGGVVFLAFQTPDGSACDYAGLAYDTNTGSSP